MMNRHAFTPLLLVLLVSLLQGCFGRKQPPPAPTPVPVVVKPREPTAEEIAALKAQAEKTCAYAYGPEEVVFNIFAAEDVNFYSNQAHTVYVVFYQLSEPNTFKQLLETPEGVGRLLEGKKLDPSFLSVRPLPVQPREGKQLKMDRVEGARYAAVVAGYYVQKPGSFSRLFTVPIETAVLRRGEEVEAKCAAKKLVADVKLERDGIAK